MKSGRGLVPQRLDWLRSNSLTSKRHINSSVVQIFPNNLSGLYEQPVFTLTHDTSKHRRFSQELMETKPETRTYMWRFTEVVLPKIFANVAQGLL